MPISLLPHIFSIPVNDPVRCIRPAPALIPVITEFLFMPAGMLTGLTAAFSDGIPTIVFTFSGNKAVLIEETGQCLYTAAWLNSPYLERIHIRPWQKEGALLIARFRPASFYRLFGVAAPGYGDRHCRELSAALGSAGRRLQDAVFACHDLDRKINAIETFLLENYRPEIPGNALLERSIRLINDHNGQIRVQRLAQILRVSSKWLERHFLSSLGLSPKEYIRQRRFLHACLDLNSSETADLGALALEHGYCDQNHLTKDFRRFTGKTPLQYYKAGNIFQVRPPHARMYS